MEKNSWEAAGMSSDQGTSNICPIGFQSCGGPVTPVTSPVPLFEGVDIAIILRLSHHCMLGMWGADNLSLQFTGQLIVLKELHCTQSCFR